MDSIEEKNMEETGKTEGEIQLPLVLYRADHKIDVAINAAESLVEKVLKPLAKRLKADGLIFNLEDFKEFSTDGNMVHEDEYGFIGLKLLTMAREDIKRAKIQSPKIQAELIDKACVYYRDGYEQLRNSFNHQIYQSGLVPDDFNFDEAGNPSVSETCKARLEEKYTTVIDSEEDLEYWIGITTFCEAANTLEAIHERSNMKSFIETHIDKNHLNYIKLEKRGQYFDANPDPRGFLREKGLTV